MDRFTFTNRNRRQFPGRAVRRGVLILFGLLGGALVLPGQTGRDMDALDPMRALVWKYDLEAFTAPAYHDGVEALISAFEAERGYPIEPGSKRRVGLKVYTNSGPGIATPIPLVEAVVAALLERGYRKDELFIIDLDESHLREAGFLPAVSTQGDTFGGIPVYVLETGSYYDPNWFYDNPLPAHTMHRRDSFDSLGLFDSPEEARTPEDRKSFLPVPLLLDVDFWINLPMVLDHPALGISGALTNPTLWSVSNNKRFFMNPANAPAATAEIAAIPELQEGWIFTIMTLETYQFIGGPLFNSLYTKSRPELLLSRNAVILDYFALRLLNAARREHGFDMVLQEQPLFYYAETLGLGRWNPDLVTVRELP